MNRVGLEGERAVARYLAESGYRILEKNYRSGHREIDIIAMKDDVIAFVEVKKRTGNRFGSGLESITPSKRNHICAAAKRYVHSRGLYDRNVRFDVVSIDGDELRHVENAFQPRP
jgi:putative endonuclease